MMDLEFDFYLGATSLDLRVYATVEPCQGRRTVRITRIHPTCDERLDLDLPLFLSKHKVLADAISDKAREFYAEARAA